ncbi:MAG: hypothetical protein AAF086_06135 [Planctomycetota bacterium]
MPEGKIRTVDPGRPAPEPGLLLPDTDPVRWISRRLSIPLGQPVEDAWALADESVLNEFSRAVWNGNGLRLGVMPASRGRAMAQTLGSDIDHRDTQILSYGFPEEIRESPTLRAEFFADLTIPPRPVTMEFFTRGRLRMLMASRPLGNGSTRVTLTPQHYLRRTTLLPRSPQERKLDGRVFDELTIEVTVGPRDILLLGFYQPPPPASLEDNAEGENDAPVPETKPDPDEDAPPVESGVIEFQPDIAQTPPASETLDDDGPTPDEVEPDQDDDPPASDEAPPLLNLGRGLFTTGITDDDSQFLFLLRPMP